MSTVKTVATMKSREGQVIATVRCEFTAKEWAILQDFTEFAEELKKTHILSVRKGQVAASLRGTQGRVIFGGQDMPDRDHVVALLVSLRPFMLQEEPANFLRVRNILSRHLGENEHFSGYLEDLKKLFYAGRSQALKAVSEGVVLNSDEMFEQWMNGFIFHRDREKRVEFKVLHDELMPFKFTEALYVIMAVDKARAALRLAALISAMTNSMAGERAEENGEAG